jgi:phosphoribosylformimino-5-aminoimidazole carboxamide ribotide isomerase
MTKFRPCIDLHSGQVKQIVGGTLSQVATDLKTNYVSKLPASHYAGLYQKHDLRGGHVVKLGPGNEEAAQEALKTWPGGLQVAGGITDKNAQYWIDQGADKVSPRARWITISSLGIVLGRELNYVYPFEVPGCLRCLIARVR